ncbi:uncharacterized protein N0V89_000469 [Didymosphaeria variabile]|uniref:Uncharacterized protein n=1 Tax=Didymosphaeria variabile TaxID=1932322 RepID=A0A9W9CFS1_9PLEO|nr:uncharacterized protein N0V89_000469 [Didymosphaeria variabile]KAJ4359912.1 hypothetical protein N0V89_000469 [Didymosphaeria variabile]
MCDTNFTFGQRGNHYFQSSSRRDYTRLPKKLTFLLTSAQSQEVHHLALGFEDSFLLTWRDKHGRDHIESQGLPTELTNFLYATNAQGRLLRNVPAIRLTLGPHNSSFFVHDSASYIWMNLPSELLTALQARIKDGNWIDRPRIVALGADSNFLLITEKHAAVWDLGFYNTISRMLEYSRTQTRGIADVRNVTLHPYRYQCFVALSMNGTLISENVPPHEAAGVERIRAAILKDTKEMEKKAQESQRRIESVPRRPNMQHQATLRRDWGERKQEVRAQSKGLRLSLSLSVSAAGIAGSFSKMLG